MQEYAQTRRQFATLTGMLGALPVAAAACGVLSGRATAQAPQDAKSPAVIELFTSQGCSSCPKADKLLGHYAARSDVIALSYSVHYWDYLGWKDTLANPKFTERQKAYAKARGDGQVYTPQIVVGGHQHAVGSNKAAIDAGIAQLQKSRLWVPVSLVRSPAGAKAEIGATEALAKDAIIWLAMVTRRVDVMIERGENAGQTLTYHNAVRSFSQAGQYDGKALEVVLEGKPMQMSEADQAIVLVQNGTSGPIIGGASLRLR